MASNRGLNKVMVIGWLEDDPGLCALRRKIDAVRPCAAPQAGVSCQAGAGGREEARP